MLSMLQTPNPDFCAVKIKSAEVGDPNSTLIESGNVKENQGY